MKPRAVLKELDALFENRWSTRDLVLFHARHKFQLMAHSTDVHKQLAQLVASASHIDPGSLERAYRGQFNEALKSPTTTGRNTAVLDQIFAILKGSLNDKETREVNALIEQYRRKEIPLTKPLTLIRKHIKKLQIAALLNHSYLQHQADSLRWKTRQS